MTEVLARVAQVLEHQLASNALDRDAVDFDLLARNAVGALLPLSGGLLEAMTALPAIKEVDSAVYYASLHGMDLHWAARGEKPPLAQAFEAAIRHVIGEGA